MDKPASPFTRVKRMPKRGVYDRRVIEAILDAAPFCHVGHIIDGRPVVIPTLHWREGEHVYWHGNAASRMLRKNATGEEVCLTASLFDGWVMARSAFHHSANYRSVMCFGVARAISDATEKEAALAGFMERQFPGRWAKLRPVSGQELKATIVLTMPIEETSAKVRTGPPIDDPEDLAWPVWAGVLPATLSYRAPVPAPDMPAGVSDAPPVLPEAA